MRKVAKITAKTARERSICTLAKQEAAISCPEVWRKEEREREECE